MDRVVYTVEVLLYSIAYAMRRFCIDLKIKVTRCSFMTFFYAPLASLLWRIDIQ